MGENNDLTEKEPPTNTYTTTWNYRPDLVAGLKEMNKYYMTFSTVSTAYHDAGVSLESVHSKKIKSHNHPLTNMFVIESAKS